MIDVVEVAIRTDVVTTAAPRTEVLAVVVVIEIVAVTTAAMDV